MPEYLAPGVFMQDVCIGPRKIEAVGTSHALFVGRAPDDAVPSHTPTLITSMAAFDAVFAAEATHSTHLSLAVQGFFENGGGRCHVMALPASQSHVTLADLSLTSGFSEIALVAAPGYVHPGSWQALISHAEAQGRFAVLDSPHPMPEPDELTRGSQRLPDAPTGQAAAYLPWVTVVDPLGDGSVACPPSGHICGAYAQTDTSRGVWKAPAGIALRGVSEAEQGLDRGALRELVAAHWNPIAASPRGTLIWGARTLALSQPEYRYVPVRRCVTMVQKSIDQGLAWTVFERHAPALWHDVVSQITEFLDGLFRQGVFVGTNARDAFFVRCNHSTMTQDDINNGRLIVQVGLAVVKPAEFVIFNIHSRAGRAP